MKKRVIIKLIFINVFFNLSLYAMAPTYVARVIPVSTDQGQIKVLLGQNPDNYWNDFGGEFSPPQRANIAAQNYLNNYTNGLYNIAITGQMPWQKVTQPNRTDFFHVVPVQFKSGKELYQQGRNQWKQDFAWVTPNDVKSGTFQHPRKGEQTIARGLVSFFNQEWDNLLPQIQKLLQIVPPVTPAPLPTKPTQPVGPQTDNSIGKYKLAPWGTKINPKPNSIHFYNQRDPYYEFTNFQTGYPFTLDGKQWPTTEHYFQAMKSADPRIQETVRKLSTPREAWGYFRKNPRLVRPDWRNINLDVMLRAVRVKFNQNPTLKNLLLGTRNAIIVEDTSQASYDDPYWGNGLRDNGDNHLGRILMHTRAELLGIIPKNSPYPYPGSIMQPQPPTRPTPTPPVQPRLQDLAKDLKNLQSQLNKLQALL